MEAGFPTAFLVGIMYTGSWIGKVSPVSAHKDVIWKKPCWNPLARYCWQLTEVVFDAAIYIIIIYVILNQRKQLSSYIYIVNFI